MAEDWCFDSDYQEWLNELAENIDDSWDDDVAMEAIVLAYVRYLEGVLQAASELIRCLTPEAIGQSARLRRLLRALEQHGDWSQPQ